MFVPFLVVTVGYFLGSLPAGYFIPKWMRGVDIREMGSHSTGFTNVLRNLGFWYGFLVLLADMGKAWLLIAAVGWGTHSVWLQAMTLGALMLGSKFPVFLHFQGGRGVAMLVGGVIPLLSWLAVIVLAVLWAVIFLATRTVMSLTNLIFALVLMSYLLLSPEPVALKLLGVGAVLFLAASHLENIRRILRREERPLFFKTNHS